jgi:acetyl esterase/lipase
MRPEDYPPQEPFSDPARRYHDEVMRQGAGIAGEDIAYGEDPYQRILVCPAKRPDGSLLAFLHGGGWTNGYKEWMAFMAPAFAEAGITFASVGYRLAPGHVFPTGFDDACEAMRWLGGHARDLGADPKRVFVGGHSAGGHYAALMSLKLPAGTVRGCLPISGVYDFRSDSGLPVRPRFLGPADSGAEVAASPIAAIDARPPPFLLAHGSEDFPHLMHQAERMEAAVRAASGEVERLVLPGRNHFTASYAGGERNGPWVPRAIDWIRTH